MLKIPPIMMKDRLGFKAYNGSQSSNPKTKNI